MSVAGSRRQQLATAVVCSLAIVTAAALTHAQAPETTAEWLGAKPRVEYVSLEAARDSVLALLRRAVNPADTAIHIEQKQGSFKYWHAGVTIPALTIEATVRDTSGCPGMALENALQAAGWVQVEGYDASGPDGGVLGLGTKKYLCLIRSRWDGGDDSDSTYVLVPGCTVIVTVVPRRNDDTMKP